MQAARRGIALLGVACACAGPLGAQDAPPDGAALTPAATARPGDAPRPAPMPGWRQAPPGAGFVDTSDPAVPGAEEVLEDTPNALAWARYQRGAVEGWGYRLFPDGSAVVLPEAPRAEAAFLLSCTAGVACEISDGTGVIEVVPAIGAPAPAPPGDADGRALAGYLARWVLAGTGSPPEPDPAPVPGPVEPDPAPAPPESAMTAPAATGPTTAAAPAPARPGRRAAPRVPSPAPAGVTCVAPDPFYPDGCRPAAASPPPAVPVAQPDADPPRMTLAERYALACSLNGGLTPRYTDHADQQDRTGKLRISLGCSARVTDRLSLRVSVIHFPVPGQKAPWDPDFTYALTYRINDMLSLSYSSYTARFSGDGADVVSSLLDGSLRLAMALPRVELGEGRTLACTLGIRIPDPTRSAASLGCQLPVTERLRLGVTGYAYAAGEQDPWNPDFSYTASYRISDRLQLNYSNYGANRFPWNPADPPGKGVAGGSLSLSWKLAF